MPDAKNAGYSSVTEQEFQNTVISLAKTLGYTEIYHTYDSRKSPEGFPDLIMLRGTRMVVAELKSEKGVVQPAQRRWLEAFALIPGAEVFIWRPHDIDEIAVILGGA